MAPAATNPKALPDAEGLAKALKIEVYNKEGERIAFGSLFETQKIIVVFIRHFFCGSCQAYVKHLAEIPTEQFERASVKIVVVGCGQFHPISAYAEITGFTGPIYADPSRELYHALGMNIESLDLTPSSQQKRSYLPSSRFLNVVQSITRGPLKHPSLIGKQGNISQLGGDFIFGPGAVCTFASRMQHTEDHIEISELMEAAGISLS